MNELEGKKLKKSEMDCIKVFENLSPLQFFQSSLLLLVMSDIIFGHYLLLASDLKISQQVRKCNWC